MKISIIIPLYNKQNFIKRAVDSVLNQNFSKFELIIVNDGSTDNSFDVISNIVDHRIKIINKTNGGVSSARNQGIYEASYEWICFLDADDYWLPNHLEEIIFLIENYSEAKIYSTLIQEKSKKYLKVIPNSFPENYEGYVENYFNYAISNTIFHSSSVCINKKSLIEINQFDEKITHGEDLDVWFKLLMKNKGAIKSVPTVIYDLTSENRAMKSYCNINRHLISKINFYRDDKIAGLNKYIDYFILRNAIQYYFSKNKKDIVPIISSIKDKKSINKIWEYIYMEQLYFINSIFYKLYKKFKSKLK